MDSIFVEDYASRPDHDLTSTKLRISYFIICQGCQVWWVSKIQTQCALSTMESKYLALSQVMQDLIPVKEI